MLLLLLLSYSVTTQLSAGDVCEKRANALPYPYARKHIAKCSFYVLFFQGETNAFYVVKFCGPYTDFHAYFVFPPLQYTRSRRIVRFRAAVRSKLFFGTAAGTTNASRTIPAARIRGTPDNSARNVFRASRSRYVKINCDSTPSVRFYTNSRCIRKITIMIILLELEKSDCQLVDYPFFYHVGMQIPEI